MNFISENWRDIQRYYGGTYLKFTETGERLYRIDNVTPSTITGVDEDEKDFVLYLDDAAPYHVAYVLPHRAVFQHKNEAYLLQRIPQRQYSRGLSAENTRIIPVMGGDAQTIGFTLLKAFVNKQRYFTLRQALFDKGKEKSVALTSRLSFDKLRQYVLVDTIRIGQFDRERSVLQVHPLFNNEVKELVAADPFQVTIQNG
jgi:hypothetical protein